MYIRLCIFDCGERCHHCWHDASSQQAPHCVTIRPPRYKDRPIFPTHAPGKSTRMGELQCWGFGGLTDLRSENSAFPAAICQGLAPVAHSCPTLILHVRGHQTPVPTSCLVCGRCPGNDHLHCLETPKSDRFRDCCGDR